MPNVFASATRIAILFALSAARAAGAQAAAGTASLPSVPYIESSATGEVRLAPDRATVTIGVETHATSAAGASAANARVQRVVLDTLRAMGFATAMMTTSDFDVSPARRSSDGEVIPHRYAASNSIEVHLTDLARIGDVIDAALARGATTAGDVAFSLSSSDSAQQVAVATATAQARRQAAALAAALGGSLGELLQATTQPQGDEFPFLGFARTSAPMRRQVPGTSITPKEIVVEATVVARWRFIGH
jgi:uncharacterized protein YggE